MRLGPDRHRQSLMEFFFACHDTKTAYFFLPTVPQVCHCVALNSANDLLDSCGMEIQDSS